jgi:hypothetical protein
VSVVLLLTLLGVRPNLLEELTWPAFWSKLVFSLALAAAGWLAVRRLCAPGARTAALPFYLGAPVLAIWLASAVALLQAAPETRAVLFWGSTWRYCPLLIALISAPLFAAMLTIMRSRTNAAAYRWRRRRICSRCGNRRRLLPALPGTEHRLRRLLVLARHAHSGGDRRGDRPARASLVNYLAALMMAVITAG